VLQGGVQHLRNPAKDVRQPAVLDLVFEIEDDDGSKGSSHESDWRAPICRRKPGWSSLVVMR
jgi:hypothetical protein